MRYKICILYLVLDTFFQKYLVSCILIHFLTMKLVSQLFSQDTDTLKDTFLIRKAKTTQKIFLTSKQIFRKNGSKKFVYTRFVKSHLKEVILKYYYNRKDRQTVLSTKEKSVKKVSCILYRNTFF